MNEEKRKDKGKKRMKKEDDVIVVVFTVARVALTTFRDENYERSEYIQLK